MQIADYYTGKGKERARVEIARAFSTCCEFLHREQSGIDFPLRKPVATLPTLETRLLTRQLFTCSRDQVRDPDVKICVTAFSEQTFERIFLRWCLSQSLSCHDENSPCSIPFLPSLPSQPS